MKAIFLMSTSTAVEVATPFGYVIGAVIALFILVYLLYSLVKPEKF